MKWVWLVALPWVLDISTSTPKYSCCQWGSNAIIATFPQKEDCMDMAQVLNEMHIKRIEERNKNHPCHDLTINQCEETMQDKLSFIEMQMLTLQSKRLK